MHLMTNAVSSQSVHFTLYGFLKIGFLFIHNTFLLNFNQTVTYELFVTTAVMC